MVKTFQISQQFDIVCESDGEIFRVSVVQRLPWHPVVESDVAYNKDDGNKLFSTLKRKYATPIFKGER